MEERLLEMEERGLMERLEWQKERIAMESEIEMLRRRLRTQKRPESPEPEPEPEPSCVSFKSERSNDGRYFDFKGEQPSAEKRIHQRPDSAEPEPSCVSFKSDWSHQRYISFKGGQPSAEMRVDQESSEVPSGQSAQQHQTHLDSIFMVCTCTTTTFTSILFTIISMLHFSDQWFVSLSNKYLMFASMISV
ncbi:uncharacterized protein LOC116036702 isoform X3 [Sander lucioperca]|uniref:uncharacterized protein LOC116036702 isoform X3 n=1 Tax=Sander lucioperca TaxID=283035 RepID=UPI0016539491|nr:uncharacterized protein LOC116036702 isoform X3 [Sander lucioperca]